MSNRHRVAARDYKHGGTRPGRFDLSQYRQFGAGLAVGLCVALGLWLHEQRNRPIDADGNPAITAGATEPAESPPAGENEPADSYDFYDMLPKFEVVVAEQERDVRRDLPSLTVERPGAYVLQAGSYRNLPDAERLRSMLAKQGIEANIQRVSVDADTWHRVRIGPYRDLQRLNATRNELRASDIDSILIRIGD